METNRVDKLRNKLRVLNHLPLLNQKISGDSTEYGLIEFHPTESCNLRCTYCTYELSNLARKTFPFSKLNKLVQFNPKAIVIAGGGEPTIYASEGKKFNDLITYLRKELPETKLGLITNGEFFPEGAWSENIDWVRLSIDFKDGEKYAEIKKGNLGRVLNNLLLYLKSPIKNVGVGYLVHESSLGETVDFSKFIYDYVEQNIGVEYLEKLNLQIRNTCKIASCNCPSSNYKKTPIMTPDTDDGWNLAVEEEKEKVNKLPCEIQEFMVYKSNILSFQNMGKLDSFNKCYLSLIRGIVKASGDLHSCVIKAASGEGKIGNIITDDIITINNNQRSFFELKSCNGHLSCCRIDGQKNVILENNLTADENIEGGYFF